MASSRPEKPGELCYRDNVTCGDRLLSVETRDTGPEEAAVRTRVLDEDNRLLATRTVPYTDYVDMSDYDPDDSPAVVQLIMEEQHQAMVTAANEGLFEGELQETESTTTIGEPDGKEGTEPEANAGVNDVVDEGADAGADDNKRADGDVGTPLRVRDLEDKPTSQVNLFGMMTLDEVILNSLVSRRREIT